MVPTIFPSLRGRTWAEVDLNARAKAAYGGTLPNPLLDPDACARFVDGIAASLGVDHTYGGYLEPRNDLWAGHYHAADTMLHLGLDMNVPAGTPVAAPSRCRVTRTVRDPDRDGGWGGLVFMRLDIPHYGARHFLYAHLASGGLPEPGTRFRAGEVVGHVGAAAENGGWFPHLHVQCLDDTVVDRHWPELEAMDGYGPDAMRSRPDMPDPTGLVFGR